CPPPTSPLFPYTTLFRSHRADADEDVGPETSWLTSQLALEADGSAEQRRETQLEEQLQPEHIHHLRQEVFRLELFLQLCLATLRSEEHTSELQSRGHLVC